jgi:AcrR family transcriptional regulator
MSFYRNFPSKSDLISAFLKRRHERWMAWFETEVTSSGEGTNGIANTLKSWFEAPDFRGCAFINAFAEGGALSEEHAKCALDHKRQLEEFVAKLAQREGVIGWRSFATAAMIVIEGTIVRAQMTGDHEVAIVCQQLLKSLKQAHGLRPATRPSTAKPTGGVPALNTSGIASSGR